MIQGGCPDGNGMGGPGYTIKGEFSQNGFKNDLTMIGRTFYGKSNASGLCRKPVLYHA